MNPSRWLALAATPSFAAMALASALRGVDPMVVLCSHGGMSSLGGMTMMYALMAIFHASPWLRLMRVHHRRSL